METQGGSFVFEGSARKVLHALKYEGMRGLASVLVIRIASAVSSAELRLLLGRGCSNIALVPVPTSKEKERGYNQAAVLASALANYLDVEVVEALATKKKSSLVGASRTERKQQVRGVFEVTPFMEKVRGRVAIIVDDTVTTGSTLAECKSTLEAAGLQVYCMAFARVPLALQASPLNNSKSVS